MASIKTTLCAESNCGLLVNNISGFRSSDNPSGFLMPGIDTPSILKDYLITDVYFFTFLIKNNSDGTLKNVSGIPGNSAKQVNYTSGVPYATLMSNANIPQHISFTEDGYFSVYQLAIPKESVKDTVQSASGDIYYVKDNLEVWLRGVKVDLSTIIMDPNINWNNNNIVMLRTDFVSKCFLENCFSTILAEFVKNYTDPMCVREAPINKTIKDRRDLLFMITNTIQYYVELGQYNKAAKLISDVSYCNICAEYVIAQSNLKCNCNA